MSRCTVSPLLYHAITASLVSPCPCVQWSSERPTTAACHVRPCGASNSAGTRSLHSADGLLVPAATAAAAAAAATAAGSSGGARRRSRHAPSTPPPAWRTANARVDASHRRLCDATQPIYGHAVSETVREKGSPPPPPWNVTRGSCLEHVFLGLLRDCMPLFSFLCHKNVI